MGFFKLNQPRDFHLPGHKESRVFDNQAKQKEHRVHFKRQVSSRGGLFSLTALLFFLVIVIFLIFAFSKA